MATEESSAPPHHKRKILAAQSSDTIRTLVISGRPVRLLPNDYIKGWEKDPEKIRQMVAEGIIPAYTDVEDDKRRLGARSWSVDMYRCC